jgi:hypothetical protein
LKLGIDVLATTIATVLRRSGLGQAPRRIGPTWTQFLRSQADGLLCGESRSEWQDSSDDLARAPRQEAQAPASDDSATAADMDAIHDPSRQNRAPIPTVLARPRGFVTPVPPGAHVRDGPAMAA